MSNLVLRHLKKEVQSPSAVQSKRSQRKKPQQPSEENNSLVEALSKLDNEQIALIMKPLTAKFVVYKHKGNSDIKFGWKRNEVIAGEVLVLDDESVEPVWFGDDLKDIVRLVNVLNNPIAFLGLALAGFIGLSLFRYLKNEKSANNLES